jgi:hypothetical protein
VDLRSVGQDALKLTFRLDGDLGRLRIPSTGPQRLAECLWEHTCFEVFVVVKNGPAYREFNFSPSGEWASYRFFGYRELDDGQPDAPAPSFRVRRSEDWLRLDTILHLDRVAPTESQAPLRLGLAAVIEDEHGALSYWALKHPPGRPDFHQHDNFAVEINRPLCEDQGTYIKRP